MKNNTEHASHSIFYLKSRIGKIIQGISDELTGRGAVYTICNRRSVLQSKMYESRRNNILKVRIITL